MAQFDDLAKIQKHPLRWVTEKQRTNHPYLLLSRLLVTYIRKLEARMIGGTQTMWDETVREWVKEKTNGRKETG